MFGQSEQEKLTQKMFLLIIHIIVIETNKEGGFQKPGYATRRITITSHEVETLKSVSFKVRNSRNVRS